MLCRPQGGLNDILSQIEACRQYAETFNRTLIVDTAYEGSSTFHDDLRNYVQSRDPRIVPGLNRARFPIEAMTVAPGWLRGRIDSYRAELRHDAQESARLGRSARTWQDVETGQALSFDFSRDHDEQLLVHHQMGGRNDSVVALARMRLRPALASELKRRLDLIGGPYTAIHVRHTDYRSLYERRLAKLQASPPAKLFVATDNAYVLGEFRAALGANRVFSFARLPGGGKPLHTERLDSEATFERNCDAFLDLLMLALSTTFIRVRLDEKHPFSGYTLLALCLFKAPNAVRDIVGRTDIDYDRLPQFQST